MAAPGRDDYPVNNGQHVRFPKQDTSMENGTQLPKPPSTGDKKPENAATALDAEVTNSDSGIMPIDEGTMREAPDGVGEKTTVDAGLEDTEPDKIDKLPTTPAPATEARPLKPRPKDFEPCVYDVSPSGFRRIAINVDQHVTTIGNDRENTDIHIDEPNISQTQVVIVSIGDQWLVMDCGSNDHLRVNGVATRQFVAEQNARCVLTIGQSLLVFCGNEAEKSPHPETAMLNDLYTSGLVHEDLAVGELTLKNEQEQVVSKGAPIILGNHEICDYFLLGSNVQPFHALIYWDRDGIYLDPLNNKGVLLSNQPVNDSSPVENGTTITIADVKVGARITPNHKDRCAQLYPAESLAFDYFGFTAIGDTPSESFTVSMVGQGVTLGRGNTCDIILADSFSSREHAQVIPSGKSLTLFDTYSSNGVFVNGERVRKSRVHVGDIIEIGHSHFLVHYA
jgi:pSer/pThr/pTyr-binding forkhead associated (FHA) protein